MKHNWARGPSCCYGDRHFVSATSSFLAHGFLSISLEKMLHLAVSGILFALLVSLR